MASYPIFIDIIVVPCNMRFGVCIRPVCSLASMPPFYCRRCDLNFEFDAIWTMGKAGPLKWNWWTLIGGVVFGHGRKPTLFGRRCHNDWILTFTLALLKQLTWLSFRVQDWHFCLRSEAILISLIIISVYRTLGIYVIFYSNLSCIYISDVCRTLGNCDFLSVILVIERADRMIVINWAGWPNFFRFLFF